jgi:prepilin-type N-terminal cleavage/methylation domain-containing protein/prepilin-type processing-associated H-X9-DG protein
MSAQIQLRRRKGFTLVELLVVIGIITILLAILLPAVSRARESGERAKCASNLRQIAVGFTIYANENRGRYPGDGNGGLRRDYDWIFWQSDRNLADSAIAKVLRNADPNIFRCPADDVTVRYRHSFDPQFYRYSYTYNWLAAWRGSVGRGPVTAVHRSSEKILLIDESEWTVQEGFCALDAIKAIQPTDPTGGAGEPLLAARHYRPRIPDANWGHKTVPLAIRPDRDEKGNVAFIDGHVDFVARQFTWDLRHMDGWRP